ncbi:MULTISPECIES: hypothetical protein [Enterobacteriaceae]|uniref:hypothetical protein n=1 Tax=Enterobacteriaceae TaxID=543 RepID=UPI0013A6D140|nr:hypothetical protein [Klebsiella michiganensis]MCW9457495.1 hypothetical protein [Klebsiella michiganensis]
MSDSEVYQDDHVPEGARPNRWQSRICSYRSITTINLFIPCNVIATCGMWEHRQKCASL